MKTDLISYSMQLSMLKKLLVHKLISKEEYTKIKEINILKGKKNKLVDMRLEDSIDKATYEAKYADLIVT